VDNRVEIAEVNGEPAAIIWSGDQVLVVLVVEVDRGLVSTIRAIANPDKLHFLYRRI
jgi:hypothetical protein